MNRFIKQFIIIIGFWALGELLVHIIDVPFPGSIVGLVLLTLSLRRGWVKIESVQELGTALVKYMALFFIVPATSIIVCWDAIQENWIAITVASVVSMLIVMISTALIFKALRK